MAFSLVAGEKFTVRVIQSANNGSVKWANTLEYIVSSDIDEDGAALIAGNVVGAFQAILINQYVVEKVVVSTYTPDGRPYNPDSFVTFPFNLVGLRSRFGETPVDLAVCLRLDKRASSGRSGRMLLRGVLHEGMLTTVGGKYNFQFPGGLDSVDFGDGLTRIQQLITLDNAQMALVSDTYARPVETLTVSGISIKKLNNKYFDRR